MITQDATLLVLGDVHGQLDALAAILCDCASRGECIDAVLCTGDVGADLSPPAAGFASHITHSLYEVTVWGFLKLVQQLGCPLLVVPGNHDHPERFRQILGEHDLASGSARIAGVGRIEGIGGSPHTGAGWPHEWDDELVADDRRSPIDVLLTHTPPAGSSCAVAADRRCRGSRRVRVSIGQRRPWLVVCGHIHEAVGTDFLDGAVVVNPGALLCPIPAWATSGLEQVRSALTYTLLRTHAGRPWQIVQRFVTPSLELLVETIKTIIGPRDRALSTA